MSRRESSQGCDSRAAYDPSGLIPSMSELTRGLENVMVTPRRGPGVCRVCFNLTDGYDRCWACAHAVHWLDVVAPISYSVSGGFLHEMLAEEVRYSVVREVLPLEPMRTFDVEVDEFHTLVANDVVVHNCAPPFRQAEFDIIYNQGISREGSLIDMGVDNGIVRKSGAWYTYEGDQLGQGKENSRSFLKDNPDLADEIELKIKDKLGIGPRIDVPIDLTAPVPIDMPVPVDL